MKAIKNFEEFVRNGTVKRQAPDKSRAEFLIKEADRNYLYLLELIKKIGINNNNANSYIETCHNILMGIIRAKLLLKGYNASGLGAHEAEVTYMRNLGFNEKDVQFADQIRYFRNGILYYGTGLDKEYAEKAVDFIKNNYLKLKNMLKS